ncbi:MAG TPA: MFS transporter, partial [Anaerolineales bacterium]|nr:MFS transporter [Anaerolineales bacterium]
GALAGLLVPLLALGFHFAPSLAIAYPLLYFLQGLYESSWMPGAINYVLEAAPDSRRPLYIGLYNTLAGILVATSFLGGILLQATSFPVLFVTVAVGTGLGVAVSTRLPTPKPRPRLTDRKGRSAVNRRARPATSPAGAEEARRALSSEPGASSRAAGPPNRFSSHPNRW